MIKRTFDFFSTRTFKDSPLKFIQKAKFSANSLIYNFVLAKRITEIIKCGFSEVHWKSKHKTPDI